MGGLLHRGWCATLVVLVCGCPPSKDTARETTVEPGADGPPTGSSASAAPVLTMNSSATATDLAPIDALVTELSGSGEWRNGLFQTIERPATATAADLVADVLASSSFEAGKVKRYALLGSKVVRIGTDPDDFVAAVVDTDLGRKVVLLQYEQGLSGWWSRVFDVATAGPPPDLTAIDRVAAELGRSRLWKNGHFAKIDRPETATVAEVVADVVAESSLKKHTLVGSKKVRIGGDTDEYVGAVIDTDAGRKVVLLRYEKRDRTSHWWSRVLDAR